MPTTAEDLRQHYLAETDATDLARCQPGSFGCHELLDRTHLLVEQLESQLLQHPACLQNPDWFTLAHQAHSALAELYQTIGSDHLEPSHKPNA